MTNKRDRTAAAAGTAWPGDDFLLTNRTGTDLYRRVAAGFRGVVDRLASLTGSDIPSWEAYREALRKRLDAFGRAGCVLADHALDGGTADRGRNILDHTPMESFGDARQLVGCLNWLIDDAAADFVTGVTIPIDGGFLACSGV